MLIPLFEFLNFVTNSNVSHHLIYFEFISTTKMIQSEIITSERKWLSWIDYVIYNIVKRSGWDRFYKHLINMKWGVRQ